jgi:hypothetical protein
VQIDVYCDESRQDLLTSNSPHSNYFLIGGLWVSRERRVEFNAKIRELRQEHSVLNEFKWHKISPSRLSFYEALVDLFVASGLDMRFRCVVVNRKELDLSYHDDDAELGYYKFYYQLLHNWMESGQSYAIFCDLRTNRLRTRQGTLERVLRRSSPGAIIERVQGVSSAEVGLLQLSDVLLGAASTRLNGVSLSDSKESIVARLEVGLGRRQGLSATWPGERKFNVFKMSLGQRR